MFIGTYFKEKTKQSFDLLYYYTPTCVKENLSFILNLIGDPLLTVPLEAAIFSTAISNIYHSQDTNSSGYDEDSSGLVEETQVYLMCLFAMTVLIYPGQFLIAEKQAEKVVGKKDEEDSLVKKVLRMNSVVTIAAATGLAGYLVVDKAIKEPAFIAPSYGIFSIAINGFFRQIFFNSSDTYNQATGEEHKYLMLVKKAITPALCAVYAVSSAAPFAAAKISSCESKTECVVLTLMLANIAAGDYIRTLPSLANFMCILTSPSVEVSLSEKALCLSSAALRTGLEMASVSSYPLPLKVAIWASLTPGVAFFQFSSRLPIEKFNVEKPLINSQDDVELLDIDVDLEVNNSIFAIDIETIEEDDELFIESITM